MLILKDKIMYFEISLNRKEENYADSFRSDILNFFDEFNLENPLLKFLDKLESLNEIEDWIYSINDYAYGGFTVNIMRASMSKKELKQHDDAWGLKFGDAKSVFVVPKSNKNSKGAYQIGDKIPEHPMSLNMNNSLEFLLHQIFFMVGKYVFSYKAVRHFPYHLPT